MKSTKILTILVLVLGLVSNALTGEKIQDIMQGGEVNLRASNPDPANGATVTLRVDENPPLSWDPGDNAASHNVYFGSVDPPPFIGNQTENSYDPGLLELGKTYFWRVDDVNDINPDSPWQGPVWGFKTDDFIIVDDFERYTDGPPNCILNYWTDGVGSGTPGDPNFNPGNGTGSIGGLSTWYVYGGEQSLGLIYDNTGAGGKLKYSEVSRTVDTSLYFSDAAELSLWFMVPPPPSNSFTDNSDGTYTMTGSGTVFWDKQYYYAYKTLSGAGSIEARIDSISNANGWAKVGVMIRETLEPGSKNAFIGLTPENGMVVQYRAETGGETYETNQGGITPPHWVKLERDDAGNFVIYQSGDVSASGWKPIQNDTLKNIQMGEDAYLGMVATSNAPFKVVFSNVQTVGSDTDYFVEGLMGGDHEIRFGIDIKDYSGSTYHETYPDPMAYGTWAQWKIPLADADNSINRTNVSEVGIVVGDPNNPQPDDWGIVIVDDIQLQFAPKEEPEDQGYPDSWAAFLLGIGRDATGDYYDLPIDNCLPPTWVGHCGVPDKSQDMNGVSTFRLNLSPPAVNRVNTIPPFGAIPTPPAGGEVNYRIFREQPNQISSGDYMSLFVKSEPLQAGRYVFLIVQFEGEIPLNDDTNSYQYAFVFDADGLASNNYEPWPDFPNDFFSYTDKWYELTYSPDFGWEFFITDVRKDFTQVQSNALFIIVGSEMAVLIPLDEFDIDTPTFRATAFRHTGDFGMSGGPWSGDLSSLIGEPLLTIAGEESVIVIEE